MQKELLKIYLSINSKKTTFKIKIPNLQKGIC